MFQHFTTEIGPVQAGEVKVAKYFWNNDRDERLDATVDSFKALKHPWSEFGGVSESVSESVNVTDMLRHYGNHPRPRVADRGTHS